MDYNRFQAGSIPNISSPMGSFNIEYWFLNQSYVSNSSTNFQSLEISWNFHMKTKMVFTTPNFVAYCYPMSDLSNPANDSTPQTVNYSFLNGYNTWIYFTCGVSAILKQFFISSTNAIGTSVNFTSINVIPSSNVYLYINESSTAGYGMTLLRQLRLWNCFSCNTVNTYL